MTRYYSVFAKLCSLTVAFTAIYLAGEFFGFEAAYQYSLTTDPNRNFLVSGSSVYFDLAQRFQMIGIAAILYFVLIVKIDRWALLLPRALLLSVTVFSFWGVRSAVNYIGYNIEDSFYDLLRSRIVPALLAFLLTLSLCALEVFKMVSQLCRKRQVDE